MVAGAGAEGDVLAELRDAWVTAYNSGDAVMLAGYFADDAVMLPPNEPVLSGKALIQAEFEGWFQGERGVLEIVASEVRSTRDLAIERATYTVREGTSPDDSTRTGKYVMLCQRGPDGLWKIVWDMWNSNDPVLEETR